MGRPPKNTRLFPKKSDFVTNVDADRNFVLPLYILISVEHFFTAIFGEECGRGQIYTTGGTNTCQNKLKFNLLQQYGSAYEVEIECGNPNHRRCAWTSPGGMKEGFQINTIVTLAGRLLGLKYHQTAEFMAALGTGFLSRSNYYPYVRRIGAMLNEMAVENKQRASQDLRTFLNLPPSEPVDVTVCYDGSWLTRGFQSLFGIVTILSAETSKILDVIPVSSYCTQCDKRVLAENEVHVCQKNHDGKAGSMEMTGMLQGFLRSQNLHNMRYIYETKLMKHSPKLIVMRSRRVFSPIF